MEPPKSVPFVNPQQEGNAQHGRHEKGEGNQNRRRHHAGEPRNRAHRDPHEDAQRDHGDTLPRERHRDSLEYLFEHTRPYSKRLPSGSASLKANQKK